jgi:hypothetical protein
MAVTVYRSTDAGAPALTGSVGTLCTVLDACLVTGYGAKAAAGWTIAFTGTNKRAYRAGTGVLRPYMRVQDDAPRAAPYNNANEARIRGYEAMTTVDVGTGTYPATGNGVILLKSSGPAVAKPWIVIADDRTVYMFVMSGDYGNSYASMCFGEYYSLKSTTDNFNSLMIGNITETVAATPAQAPANENLPRLSTFVAIAAGHFVPRAWNEIGPVTTNVGIGKHGNAAHSASNLVGLMQYPNPFDNAIYLSQVWIHEINGLLVRGRMRGFWHCLHPASTLKDGDTWTGTGALAGKTFLAIGPVPDGLGTFVMEVSDTWERN